MLLFCVLLILVFCFVICCLSVLIWCFKDIIFGVVVDIMLVKVFSLVCFWVSVVLRENVICWKVVFFVVGFNILYFDWKLMRVSLVCWSLFFMMLCLFCVNVKCDFVRLLLILFINCFVCLMMVLLINWVYFGL